jgi:hypothetical protein
MQASKNDAHGSVCTLCVCERSVHTVTLKKATCSAGVNEEKAQHAADTLLTQIRVSYLQILNTFAQLIISSS